MTYTSLDTDQTGDLDFVPDERIGAPLIRSRWRKATKPLALAAVLGLGGWTAFDDTAPLRTVWVLSLEALRPYMERAAPPPVQPLAAAEPPAAPRTIEPEPAAVVPRADVAPPTPTASTEPEAEGDKPQAPGSIEPPAPLPAPVASDPLQKRALAAGLHPDLSRVLLAKLSDTDYRNAAVAIRKVLAEKARGEDLIWPTKPAHADAQFKVSLVQGANDCRRYVVMIAKDGWTTTALPMEKCGKQAVPDRRK